MAAVFKGLNHEITFKYATHNHSLLSVIAKQFTLYRQTNEYFSLMPLWLLGA